VTRLSGALLAAGLLAMPLLAGSLGACSRGSAPDVAFLPTRAVEAADTDAAFESAKTECLEEARRKGISSVTRILLFRGKTSKSDYVDCMQRKGFAEVEG